MTNVHVYKDPDALAHAAADDLAARAREAIAAHGRFSVALSGGSTPARLFDVLAARGRDALPWHATEIWWGDERTVPPDHPDSNYRMTAKHLLTPLHIPPERIHRMPGELDPQVAAREYEVTLTGALGTPPEFDYVMLGMGPDGHTASLFPGSPGLKEAARFVIANPVDSPVAGGKTTRLTLTLPAIGAARHTRFLVTGKDKAERLAAVIDGAPDAYPAQLVGGADVQWFVDAAAASKLRQRA
jgi:6-phosphogluconolactonase